MVIIRVTRWGFTSQYTNGSLHGKCIKFIGLWHFITSFPDICLKYWIHCVYFFSFFLSSFHPPFLLPSLSSFAFLGLHLQHMEGPRLGVKSELQLLACATATATRHPSCVCDPHHSSWQHWIFNPLMRPGIELTSSWILVESLTHWATTGIPHCVCFKGRDSEMVDLMFCHCGQFLF